MHRIKLKSSISVIDLFCGGGGLAYGLQKANLPIKYGIDADKNCQYPFEKNTKATFICKDVGSLAIEEITDLFGDAEIKILVGCAPCQPFSTYNHKNDNPDWQLLYSFSELITAILPDIVSMENVPQLMKLQGRKIFLEFVGNLKDHGYLVSYNKLYGPDFGLPQSRTRLVLLASRLGNIELPMPTHANRQSFVEDDKRYILLKKFLQQELKHIQAKWTNLRATEGSKQALKIPELDNWVKSLPDTQKNIAKSWLGKIYRLKTNDEAERRQLMKHSVLALEFHRAKENLAALEAIDDQNLQEVMSMFKELDSLEEVFYRQIVKQRLGIIQTLEEKIDNNNRERVIQEYLFDHLWLLDPHWERIESEQFMETRISTVFGNLENTLSEEEKLARIDIKYRKTAGTHVVVELKRPDVIVKTEELVGQIEKYRSGILKLLGDQNDTNPLSFVILLGRRPSIWRNPKGPETVTKLLKDVDAHIVLYDELLRNASNCYDEYWRKYRDVKSLEKIIEAIDAID